MPLPKAVQEAEAAAQRLYEEFYQTQQPAESEPLAPAPANDSTPTDEEPPVQHDEQSVEPSDYQAEEGGIAGEPTVHQESQPDHDGSHSWEHRYKVLSGKYNSEVPRLAADNRDLKMQLKRMQDDLAVLQQNAKQHRESLLKPEEIEEYGEGLIDVVRRAAREEVSTKEAEIEDLKRQIESLSSKTTKTVEIDFFEDLTRRIPDWNAINDDKNFHRWLDGFDELTGRRRQDLLSEAEGDRDAKRVANFFDAFKKATKTWAATASQSLESQVVPDSVRKVSSPPAKKIWTRAEINRFYTDYRRGAIDDKKAVALEADIQAALIEGRVR